MERSPAGDDALVEEVIALLPQIGKVFYSTALRVPAFAGRSVAQVKTMAYLAQRPGACPCTVGDIAHGLSVSMPAASELVDRLVEEGLVERRSNPADRRQVFVSLTARARELTDQLHALRRAQVRAAFAGLAPDERAALVRGLRALSDALGADARDLPDCPAMDLHDRLPGE